MTVLKGCTDCGRVVSINADTCPHCGSRWPHSCGGDYQEVRDFFSSQSFLWCIIVFGLGASLLWWVAENSTAGV